MSRGAFTIYVTLLATLNVALIYCIYIQVFYTSDNLPVKDYTAHNDVCSDACETINAKSCKEWTFVPYVHLCEFVCDTRLDQEALVDDKSWTKMFKCATRAESSEDLEDCGLSCSKMDSL